MSYFAKPEWSTPATTPFSGTIILQETELSYPKEKAYYPGENIFPELQLDFISHHGELILRRKDKISTKQQSKSYWDVIVGTGKVWQEKEDGAWSRGSFPLTLTDRWVGQARNCVATFVYKKDAVSNVCLQCSQETADIDDKQLGNLSGLLPAEFKAKQFIDSVELIRQHAQAASRKLPVRPLSEIDSRQKVAGYFNKMIATNAPTSMGAVWMNDTLYVHPPKTRHGLYPYPDEMRHGLYSVTKSMAGALALMYFEERYQGKVFNALLTDYVPALKNHAGWQGVTFSHTLNMVTGTVGGEGPEQLFLPLIAAETAEQAIQNIASLGDAPESPGQKFNYASTNLFVLSYALQQYVEEKESRKLNYWDLVQENVLEPIGAANFSLLHTIEANEAQAIPILAFGALPTIDEAAKIALLFANGGSHEGKQLLNKKRVAEAFAKTEWTGYSTNHDFRGANYQHSFWSKEIDTGKCKTRVTYMLGFGENYVVFLPSNAIIFRFLDEHDLDIDELINEVENLKSSCLEK
ncbi:serine hydrolase [uncultured Pontibacter sp.]|uniref:serine hydrolase domain-containing protein n=1 Tax=uncultured Pontibacter sp. TaxID=453356 RepID=UPI0026320533|nr:serine hydrolase [uncultured Pontibacter sp.]